MDQEEKGAGHGSSRPLRWFEWISMKDRKQPFGRYRGIGGHEERHADFGLHMVSEEIDHFDVEVSRSAG